MRLPMRNVKYSPLNAGVMLLLLVLAAAAQDVRAMAQPAGGSSFVYTMTNPTGPNSIVAYRRDPNTGVLSLAALYPTGGSGHRQAVGTTQGSIVTNGAFLYAVNAGSNDISAFAIGSNGSLNLLGPPVPSGGTTPTALALHGGLLYVGNQGTTQEPANYTGFTVNPDGSLSPLAGSTVTLGIGDGVTEVLFDSAGAYLLGFRVNAGQIDVFAVNSTGRLASTATVAAAAPFGAEFSPANASELLVTLVGVPGAGSYFLSPSGALDRTGSAADAKSKDPCWTAIARNGTFLWTSNFQPSSLSLFSIASDGQLTFRSEHATAAFGNASADIALDASGKFLYQLLPFPGSNPRIHVMAVGGDGTLRDITTVDVPEQHSFPMGLAIVDLQ